MASMDLVRYIPCVPALLGRQQGQRELKGEKIEEVLLIRAHIFWRQPANRELATYQLCDLGK